MINLSRLRKIHKINSYSRSINDDKWGSPVRLESWLVTAKGSEKHGTKSNKDCCGSTFSVLTFIIPISDQWSLVKNNSQLKKKQLYHSPGNSAWFPATLDQRVKQSVLNLLMLPTGNSRWQCLRGRLWSLAVWCCGWGFQPWGYRWHVKVRSYRIWNIRSCNHPQSFSCWHTNSIPWIFHARHHMSSYGPKDV